jgi:hypothetical protein
MEANPDVGVCGTWVKTFGEIESKWIYPTSFGEVFVSLMFFSPIAHPSVLIRKNVFDFYKYQIEYNKVEDYKFWVDVSKKFPIVNIPLFLLNYRVHSFQTGVIKKDFQLDLSNRIRKEVLLEFGLEFNEDDFLVHLGIALFKDIHYIEAEKWFIKILNYNEINQYYNYNDLKKFIVSHWFRIINQNADKGLVVFFYYFFSSKLPRLVNPLSIFKFLVKCIIKRRV